MMNIEEKQAALDELKKLIERDNPCPELSEGASRMVFGSGSVNADVVFVGEAPGKNEDLSGEPFVGASGKVLDELLASVQLKREEVYITSILKHRPPNNRDPKPAEKTAFWPYLLKQLAILQPKLLVTLGRHSGQAFLKDLRIGADHGHPKQMRLIYPSDKIDLQNDDGVGLMQDDGEQRTEPYENTVTGVAQLSTQQQSARNGRVGSSADKQTVSPVIILPLYHPAAALYNGSLRATLFQDFQVIPKLLQQ
jgi:DNA polymerase